MRGNIFEARRILAISPHLDDVVLSAGGIVRRLVQSGSDVIVGTMFTADTPQPAPTSQIIEELSGLWSLGTSPFQVRRREDNAAVSRLGARILHGNLLDCIYRTDGNHRCLYPTRAAVFSDPSDQDEIFPALQALLARWIDEIHPVAILCPLSVGRHVDHVVTSESVRSIAIERHLPVFLYEDFPYASGRFPPDCPDSLDAVLARTQWKITQSEKIQVDVEAKIAAISQYDSQIADIFSYTNDWKTFVRQYMDPEGHRSQYSETVWMTET